MVVSLQRPVVPMVADIQKVPERISQFDQNQGGRKQSNTKGARQVKYH